MGLPLGDIWALEGGGGKQSLSLPVTFSAAEWAPYNNPGQTKVSPRRPLMETLATASLVGLLGTNTTQESLYSLREGQRAKGPPREHVAPLSHPVPCALAMHLELSPP